MLNSSARQVHNLDQIRINLGQSIDIVILYMCIKFESDPSNIRRVMNF